MKNKEMSFFYLLLVVIFGIGTLHITGIIYSLYFKIIWTDTVIHALGGFWVAGVALWFYYLSGYVKPRLSKGVHVFLISILAAIVIGVLWEIFEVVTGATFVTRAAYVPDTIVDLIADSVGALAMAFYFLLKKLNIQEV